MSSGTATKENDMKKTKAEQHVLNYVKHCNDLGALSGIGLNDTARAQRLADAGEIVYVKRPGVGCGWAIVGHPIAGHESE